MLIVTLSDIMGLLALSRVLDVGAFQLSGFSKQHRRFVVNVIKKQTNIWNVSANKCEINMYSVFFIVD